MNRSLFLARLIGPLFAAIGIGMLTNHVIYRQMAGQFLDSYAFIYLSGLLALLGGLAIVNTHNIWTRDWRCIVTVLGWLATIGGTVRIIVPQLVVSIGTAIFAHDTIITVAAIVVLALGALLSFKGYSQ